MSIAAKALVFDLDGTLVDSVPDLAGAARTLIEELGRSPPDNATVESFIGGGMRQLVRRILSHCAFEPDESALSRQVERYVALYRARLSQLTRPYPGVAETLHALHAAGHPLAVCTNKPEELARQLLAELDLDRLFAAIVGGDTLPVRKPDPAPLLHACEVLGVMPAGAIMVGDSGVDVATARAAGCPVIAVSYGYNHGVPLAADWMVDDFPAIATIVAGA